MSYRSSDFDNEVVELLKNGVVGLLPTDTIYGISTVALNERAVQKIHKLKARDANKPFIVLIAEVDQLKQLGIKQKQADLVKKYWPGRLSVIFESADIPAWLQLGTASIAVRLPDNDELRALIRITGPIVSTSANLQGQKPAASVEEAKDYFGEQLDFYVDKGKLENEPSTLVKVENQKLKVIRQGSFKVDL